MAAKRARREGETYYHSSCDNCGFFGCMCHVATIGESGGVRRKAYILDHLAALSADLQKATDELAHAVESSPCDCTRPRKLCCCDDPQGPGYQGNDVAVAERLQSLAIDFEDALNTDRNFLKSSSDESSSSDDVSSDDDDDDSDGDGGEVE